MKILFIEDEEAARVGLKAILESKGHTVDVAGTAEQAVAELGAKQFDLLLLDIMIEPGGILNGVPLREAGKELLLRLRAGQFAPLKTSTEVPVVAITAVANLGVNKALQQATKVMVLQKPIDPEDAYQEIQPLLEGEFREKLRPSTAKDDYGT